LGIEVDDALEVSELSGVWVNCQTQ
jgi:hypothetical protein